MYIYLSLNECKERRKDVHMFDFLYQVQKLNDMAALEIVPYTRSKAMFEFMECDGMKWNGMILNKIPLFEFVKVQWFLLHFFSVCMRASSY